MKAWVYVQEALVLLINTALSGPMKMDKPVMPTGQPAVLGDGTATSPWRSMVGQEGDIPGFNFFTYVEPTDATGVNQLTFGLGCLVSLLKVRRDLHLETNADVNLLSICLAEEAVDDVSADPHLLDSIEISLKLHDAIAYSGDSNNGVGRQISIFTIQDLLFSVDGFSLAFGWNRGHVGLALSQQFTPQELVASQLHFTHLSNQLV